ncbi:MAG: immunoglobulin domain-containing protein [Verrucomicrobia bacterium]|nr:immunoglobulin domain-containing protein [Verrucomicrobiota bacterium]
MLLAFYRNTGLLLAKSPSTDSAIIRGGKEQTFTVTTWVAPATIATTWYLDGSHYTANQSVTLQANSLTPGAHTLKVVVKDATAMVRNDPKNYTQAEHTWALTIGNVPVITTQPGNASTTAGQSASFSVVVDAGGAPVSYVWKKGGVVITGATSASYSLSSSSSTDAGFYTVVATTSDGSVTSNAATLSVTTPVAPSSSGGSGGGGGALSPWALLGFALLGLGHFARRTQRS